MPVRVPAPPTTAGRRRAWLPSKEGLETEARPSSEKYTEATRSATRRSGRPAGDIAPPARTGSLTRAGLGGTALKHTQGTPVEKAARRWVISTPSVVDVGAESNVALLRSPDRLSLFDTWQAGTLTVTQAGYCVKRRVLAATAIAAGWRGFSALAGLSSLATTSGSLATTSAASSRRGHGTTMTHRARKTGATPLSAHTTLNTTALHRSHTTARQLDLLHGRHTAQSVRCCRGTLLPRLRHCRPRQTAGPQKRPLNHPAVLRPSFEPNRYCSTSRQYRAPLHRDAGASRVLLEHSRCKRQRIL